MSIFNRYPVVVLERIAVEDYLKTKRRFLRSSSKKVGSKVSDTVLKKRKVSQISEEKRRKDLADVAPANIQSEVGTGRLKDDSSSQRETFISDLVVKVKKETEELGEIAPELSGCLRPELVSEAPSEKRGTLFCNVSTEHSSYSSEVISTSNSAFSIKEEIKDSREVTQELVGYFSDHISGAYQIPLHLIKCENVVNEKHPNGPSVCLDDKSTIGDDFEGSGNLENRDDANGPSVCSDDKSAIGDDFEGSGNLENRDHTNGPSICSKSIVNDAFEGSVNVSQIQTKVYSDSSCLDQAKDSVASGISFPGSHKKVCSDKGLRSSTYGLVEIRNNANAKKISENHGTKKTGQNFDSEKRLAVRGDKILSEHKQSLAAGKGDFKCRKCREKFNCSDSLNLHSKVCDKKRFKCNQCLKKFAHKGSFLTHLQTHDLENERLHSSNPCSAKRTDNNSLEKHPSLHNCERFWCGLCPRSFRMRSLLKKHLMKHSSESLFECDHCSNKFKLKGVLKAHIVLHCGEERCKRTRNLQVHSTVMKDKRQFTQCPDTFLQSSALSNHLREHCDEKSPKDDQSVTKSKPNDALDCHFEVRRDERQFKAPEPSSLTQWENIDDEKRDNELEICFDSMPCRPVCDNFTTNSLVESQNQPEIYPDSRRNMLDNVTELEATKNVGTCKEMHLKEDACSRIENDELCEITYESVGTFDDNSIGVGKKPLLSEHESMKNDNKSDNKPGVCFEKESSAFGGENVIISNVIEISIINAFHRQSEVSSNLSTTESLEDSLPNISGKDYEDLNEFWSSQSNNASLSENHRTEKCQPSPYSEVGLNVQSGGNQPSVATEMISVPTEDSNASDKKPHQCNYCFKRFRRTDHLKNHLAVHSKERAFKCSQCSAAYKLKYKLDLHIKLHHNKCIHCNRCFKSEEDLHTHMSQLEDEAKKRRFKCSHCPKAYTKSSSLGRHIKTYHNKRLSDHQKPLLLTECETNGDANDNYDEPIICFDNTLLRPVQDNLASNNTFVTQNSFRPPLKVYPGCRSKRLLDSSKKLEAETLKNYWNESVNSICNYSSSENQNPTLNGRDAFITLDSIEDSSIFLDETAFNVPLGDTLDINDLEKTSIFLDDRVPYDPVPDDLIITDPLEESSAHNDNSTFNDQTIGKFTITDACDDSSLCFDQNAFSNSILTVNNTLKESSGSFNAFNFPVGDESTINNNLPKESSICFDDNRLKVPVGDELGISNFPKEPSICIDENVLNLPEGGQLTINTSAKESSVSFDNTVLDVFAESTINNNAFKAQSVCVDNNRFNVPLSGRLTDGDSKESSIGFDNNDKLNVPIGGTFATNNTAKDASLSFDNNVFNVTIGYILTTNNSSGESKIFFDQTVLNALTGNKQTLNNAAKLSSSCFNNQVSHVAISDVRTVNNTSKQSSICLDSNVLNVGLGGKRTFNNAPKQSSISFDSNAFNVSKINQSGINNTSEEASVVFNSSVSNASLDDTFLINNAFDKSSDDNSAVKDSTSNTFIVRNVLENPSNSTQVETEVDEDISIIEESLGSSRPTKIFACGQCGKKFWHEWHWKRHKVLHRVDKPHQCQQ